MPPRRRPGYRCRVPRRPLTCGAYRRRVNRRYRRRTGGVATALIPYIAPAIGATTNAVKNIVDIWKKKK